MTQTWNDVQHMAAELANLYPDVDPRDIPLNVLREKMSEVPSMAGFANLLTEHLLQEVQTAWQDEYHGTETEELLQAAR
ncbi:MAG: Fe-S cluster assembly protein IscX [Deltaproteobacteria bacterium]|nr:Fe-S cluster assembly protein IscX [Deltaproteobacteria bacterium]